MKYLLVDGYNIISNWPELAAVKEHSLEQARDMLVHILVNYSAWQEEKVVIVFDGYQVKGGVEHREKVSDLVEVVFTRTGETADNYIERVVGALVAEGTVQVATSDWVEQQLVWGKGAIRISSRELMDLVKEGESQMGELMAQKAARPSEQAELRGRIKKDFVQRLEKWRRS